VVKVSHRLERSLPRRAGEKTRDLLAVAFDNDFFTLYDQAVKHLAQIACQFRCRDSLHQRTSLRKIRFNQSLSHFSENALPVT
jgi:hypothetical protein